LAPGSTRPTETPKNPHYDPNWQHAKAYVAEAFGTPRVIAIPKKLSTPISTDAIRDQIKRVTAGCCASDFTGEPYKILQMDQTGRMCAKCSYTSHCLGCELPPQNQPFELPMESRDANLVFAIQWNEGAYQERHAKTLRDKSAEQDAGGLGGGRKDVVKLTDCISAFTLKEILSENDPWYCSSCKQFRQASKKFDLWKLPDIFVVHLKRFSYTKLWRDKINTFVDFPIEGLDVKEFTMNPAETKTIYDLFAVSNHMGSMGGGHYTAYCKNLKNGKWYCHDDSHVSPLGDLSQIKSDSAYVLFYHRRDAGTQPSTSTSTSTSSVASPSSSVSEATNPPAPQSPDDKGTQ